MPTTLVGLLIFLAFLTPGFVFYNKRRRISDYAAASPLAELAAFVTTSLITNALAIGLYVVLLSAYPSEVPNVSLAMTGGVTYIAPRLGRFVGFGILLLLFSSTIAFFVANLGLPKGLRWLFPPRVVSDSAWFRLFEEEALLHGQKRRVYIGLDMRDGSYVAGELDYFSTDPHEIADRDLILTDPKIIWPDQEEITSEFPRLVISARDILRIHTAYLDSSTSSTHDLAPDKSPDISGTITLKQWWCSRPRVRWPWVRRA